MNSEFGPYDTSREDALIEQAKSILNTRGPEAMSSHPSQVQAIVDEGENLIEYARSLVK